MNSVSEMRLELLFPEGLRRLIAHDEASPTSYVETLRTYLENNLSIAKTSSELYVHRSTLMERLARIKRELGLDLEDPDEQLRLRILLQAMQARDELRSTQDKNHA
jgi:DNA-binding PucR family transcriptional regulator